MIFSIVYFIVYFSIFLGLLYLLVFNRKSYTSKLTKYPKISILIAARNEEHSIERCLAAIDALDYPKDKMEVLVGNDASTDNTFLCSLCYLLFKLFLFLQEAERGRRGPKEENTTWRLRKNRASATIASI